MASLMPLLFFIFFAIIIFSSGKKNSDSKKSSGSKDDDNVIITASHANLRNIIKEVKQISEESDASDVYSDAKSQIKHSGSIDTSSYTVLNRKDTSSLRTEKKINGKIQKEGLQTYIQKNRRVMNGDYPEHGRLSVDDRSDEKNWF